MHTDTQTPRTQRAPAHKLESAIHKRVCECVCVCVSTHLDVIGLPLRAPMQERVQPVPVRLVGAPADQCVSYSLALIVLADAQHVEDCRCKSYADGT